MADLEAQQPTMSFKINEGSSSSNNFACEVCCTTITYLIFAILYGLYTSDPKYFGGDSCVDLLKWGKIMFYLCAAGTAFYGVVAPLIFCSTFCCGDVQMKLVSTFSLLAIRVAFALASLVLFIALCVAYGEGEACGSLGTLTLVYIILVGVAIGLGFVLGCCMCCCGILGAGATMGILAAANSNQNQGYGAVNTNAN